MNPKFRFFLLVVGVNLILLPSIIFAQSAEELQGKISEQQAQIEALNKEIQIYEKELTTIGTKKQTLQSALSSIEVSVKRTNAKVKSAQAQIASLELQIQQLSGHISDKEASITLDQAAIAEMVRALQENQDHSFIETVLSDQSLSGLWDETAQLANLQGAIHVHVQSLEDIKEDLTVDRDDTEAKKQQLEQQRRVLAAEEQSLVVTKREQQSLLNATKSEESTYQKILSDKRAAKEQFEAALTTLESELEYTLDPNRLPASGKGILRWPLDAVKITQYFGNTAFANSGAYSGKGHNGIDFRAAVGTPIKSALRGQVVGTGNTDAIAGCYSYGKWVLIKHGNGLSTLYAHLSQINVGQGETVNTGQVIGYSGNTGYSTGPHLHFSVYASDAVTVRKLGSGKGCNNAVIPVSATSGYLNPLNYL